MDIFLECIVKRKIGFKEYALSALICIAALAIVFFSLPYMALGVTAILDGAVVYFSYILISRFSVEFEYVLTNTELDIDKIYARRKRDNLISVDILSFDIFSYVGNEEYRAEENSKFDKINDFSNGDMTTAYYAIYYDSGKKTKIIFNPSKNIIDSIKKYIPSKVHIK